MQCPLPAATLEAIRNHARAEYPHKEACGIVLKDGRYFPAQNIAQDPKNTFELDPQDYAKASESGEIWAIAHSHTNSNPEFSPTDIQQCKALGLPYYLFSLPLGAEAWIDPNAKLPYLERPFVYGLWDCWSLVQDIYQRELGITLNDYPRGEPGEWEDPDWNLYSLENWQREGFVRLEEGMPLQKYDCLMMQIRSPNPNHVGVLMEVEANIFYQHLYGRLSEKTVWGGSWEHSCVAVYRHHTLLEGVPSADNG